jgi:hypothetical protein
MMSKLLKTCNIFDALVERGKKEEGNNWQYFGRMTLFGHQVRAVKAQGANLRTWPKFKE